MPNYVGSELSGSQYLKQTPGQLPDQAYDRTVQPGPCTFTKSPNYVLITKTMTEPFGFWYGTSQSFHEFGGANDADGGGGKAAPTVYDTDWGLITVGTRLDIHPSSWSGSSADSGNIRFVYKSGRSTGGR